MSQLQLAFHRSQSVKERTGFTPIEAWTHMEEAGTAALSGKDVEQFKEMSYSFCQGLENDYANLLFDIHSLKSKYSDKDKDFLAHMAAEIQNSIK